MNGFGVLSGFMTRGRRPLRQKISQQCGMPSQAVVSVHNVDNLYDVPNLLAQGVIQATVISPPIPNRNFVMSPLGCTKAPPCGEAPSFAQGPLVLTIVFGLMAY